MPDYQTSEGMAVEPYVLRAEKIVAWLKREEKKAKIARASMRTCSAVDQLFLLERAQKAEATARILRKVIKL
jgi:hypothetical protein